MCEKVGEGGGARELYYSIATSQTKAIIWVKTRGKLLFEFERYGKKS